MYIEYYNVTVNEKGNIIYTDKYGNVCERTKMSHPYNYDPIVIWQIDEKPNGTFYSDRMIVQEYELYNKLCKKHFNDTSHHFDSREPEAIEKFLIDYLGKEIVLCKIIEHCNQSSGYPLWCFRYKTISSDEESE